MVDKVAYVLRDEPFGPGISISPLHQQTADNILFSIGISGGLYSFIKRKAPKKEPGYWGGYNGGWWAYNLGTLLSDSQGALKRELAHIMGVLVLTDLVEIDDE